MTIGVNINEPSFEKNEPSTLTPTLSNSKFAEGATYLRSLHGKPCNDLKTFFNIARGEYQEITGVPLRINRSRPDARNMEIGCFYGGAAPETATQSRKSNCPFNLTLKVTDFGKVEIGKLNGAHNHDHDPTSLGSAFEPWTVLRSYSGDQKFLAAKPYTC